MASEISLLIPEFRNKLIEVLAACKHLGFRMEPLVTLVSPVEQSCLWKQGRTAVDAELKALALENAKAHFLATAMRQATPKATNIVTQDLPGYSWHQWGEAVVCVWIDRVNKLNWSPNVREGMYNLNGFEIYAEQARKAGLTCGNKFDDVDRSWAHVQLRPEQSPGDLYTLLEIDAEMKKRFDR